MNNYCSLLYLVGSSLVKQLKTRGTQHVDHVSPIHGLDNGSTPCVSLMSEAGYYTLYIIYPRLTSILFLFPSTKQSDRLSQGFSGLRQCALVLGSGMLID